MARIMGEIGRRIRDVEVKMATKGLTGLLMCHRFMWLVLWGGSVIVAQYASRR